MNTLLIQRVRLDGAETDILIEGNRIARIAPEIAPGTARVIDGSGKAAIPPFYNTHTHAAMTLLRGYADDMELFTWLNDYIWPAEGRLTGEDIYAGTRLALLEMIRSGTVFFNDMYWKEEVALPVVEAMGLRATLGVLLINTLDSRGKEQCFDLLEHFVPSPEGRVSLAVAPHSIYTVNKELLCRSADAARRNGQKIHIHLCETQGEVENCLKEHGCTPVAYLDKMGFLGEDVIAAHVVHVTDTDIQILKERKVTIAHCPISNMKLSSGIAPIQKMLEAGCRVTLATDGCSSNNNLDMREEMKIAALLAKVSNGPQALSAAEVLHMVDAGVIEEGHLADLLLVGNDQACMTPMFHPESNWVYAADSSLIDTVICDGRILMQGRKVEGEEEILADARRIATTLLRH